VPTTAVFFETPSNPMQELVDIAAVCELAHAAGATVVVDNVFGTPVFSHPLELGADVVVYSATKHIDGQGRALGGAVLGTAEFIGGPVKNLMRHTGRVMSRTLITEYAWDYHFDPGTNIVDVVINRLRKKIDSGHARKLIHTVRGVGYTVKA
jgi:hypothetical protein